MIPYRCLYGYFCQAPLVRRQLAWPNAVQQQILHLLDLPSPAELFGKRVLAQAI